MGISADIDTLDGVWVAERLSGSQHYGHYKITEEAFFISILYLLFLLKSTRSDFVCFSYYFKKEKAMHRYLTVSIWVFTLNEFETVRVIKSIMIRNEAVLL